MILNERTYENLYKGVLPPDVLVDTWFLDSGVVCQFELPSDCLPGILAGLPVAGSGYGSFRVSVASAWWHADVGGPVQASRFLERLDGGDDRGTWRSLVEWVEEAPMDRLTSLFIEVTVDLSVYGVGRDIMRVPADHVLEIHVHLPSGTVPTLFVSSSAWSLLRERNDTDLLAIYLLGHGLAVPGEAPDWQEQLRELGALGDTAEAVRRVRDRGRAFVLPQPEHARYRNCVLVLADDGSLPSDGNETLASLNRPPFDALCSGIERISGSTSQLKLPPVAG